METLNARAHLNTWVEIAKVSNALRRRFERFFNIKMLTSSQRHHFYVLRLSQWQNHQKKQTEEKAF